MQRIADESKHNLGKICVGVTKGHDVRIYHKMVSYFCEKLMIVFLFLLKIIWRKLPSVTPLTIGGYVYVNDVTISVEHARESEDWKLIISGAHSRHSGEYECQVPTADKQMRKQFYLTVTGKAGQRSHT